MLSDIADIEQSHKEIQIETFVNGRESVEIEIYKDADANIVEVAQRVRDRIYGTPEQRKYVADQAAENGGRRNRVVRSMNTSEERRLAAIAVREERAMTNFVEYSLPEGCSLEVLTDQSIFIKQSIDEVKGNAVIGGLIAVFVIFLFLRNVGHTAIIGITIPVSIIATFAPMQLSDVSLNIISLGVWLSGWECWSTIR